MLPLKRRVAVVTGGSRGVGRMIAEGSRRAGADVCRLARNLGAGNCVAGRTRIVGASLSWARC